MQTFLPSPRNGQVRSRAVVRPYEIETPAVPVQNVAFATLTVAQMQTQDTHLESRGTDCRTVPGRWRVEKFDDDGGLRQPPTANSSFSRITLSGSSCGNSGSWSGVIAWRNSLISVRRNRRVSPVAAGPGEGRLTERIAGVQPVRREQVFMPRSRQSSVGQEPWMSYSAARSAGLAPRSIRRLPR